MVIKLTVANCLTKRILVDNGSSANVIFLDVLKEMQAPEANIIKKTTTLIGFSGEQKTTLGEVTLPVYAEGINLYTKFSILDCPSACNMIFGRP